MRFQVFLERHYGVDQSRECRGNISKICDTTTDDKYFPLMLFLACHQPNQSLCIFKCMFGGRRPRVFSIVSEFVAKTKITDRIRINNALKISKEPT